MALTIMRRIKFCAGHRLLHHGGKCENFHGHNYVADFFVQGEQQDDVGRVIDFSDLKSRVKGWIDENWDHGFLIHQDDDNARTALEMVTPSRIFLMPYNPTAENMAKYLLEEMCPAALDGSGAKAVRVRVWETDESFAEASLDPVGGSTNLYSEMAVGQ
ncbi:6-pyruvoyl trahydropterin synthase family protein [Rhodopirellula sp. MGV]|uniref:6-pyruvoyl trahydropterin synthase family protein n=1 Tax=Rhodopirellula sp. MGV TaxID=2023130 RepID=UPI000B96029F|nr:6-carboxytetrahydropterin synthase [Rhodopirellula sp. MGV]OYP37004.1 6-pyruvoyl tetrahydrobiopterin synthase [Rhodopirellula sp. MGV]PNY36233.1 6-carboxytetrahydropterin synthase [Rhodopirellula baltica]